MDTLIKTVYGLSIFMLLFICPAYTQNNTVITGKPFTVDSPTQSYEYMAAKLPRLIASGILYRSELVFDALGISQASKFKNISSRTVEQDSVYQSMAKVLKDRNINFFIEGEMHIVNDQFYIIARVTDFKTPLASYQSPIKPISQFHSAIDDACENINFQIKQRRLGQFAVQVQVIPFSFEGTKKTQASTKDLYAVDFPARYITYNLRGSKLYSVAPYEYHGDLKQNSKAIARDVNSNVIVSGKVRFDGKGNCKVFPVLHWGGDSLQIFEISGSLYKKDEILEDVLANVQSMLNATVSAGGLTEFRKAMVNASDANTEEAFSRALADDNPSLAGYYVEQLASKKNKYRLATLLRARLYFHIGEYTTALKYAEDYVKSDSTNDAGYHMIARSSIKLSRFENAKAALMKVDVNSEKFRDILFLRGVCLYNQDSVHKALKCLNEQKKKDEKASPDLYAYIGFCYEWLAMWSEAEKNFLKQWQKDTTSEINRGYLVNFYNKYSQRLTRAKDHANAYTYFMKSYDKSKQYGSLLGAVEASLYSRRPDREVDKLVNRGIRDSVFLRRYIYLDVADLCRAQIDTANNFVPAYLHRAAQFLRRHISVTEDASAYSTLGSTYFRLNMLDSAEYFYTRAKKSDENDPMHYFNLAELQTLRMNATEALRTLSEANVKFIQDARYPYNDKDYLRGLYYFYVMENKATQNVAYDSEAKALRALLSIDADPSPLFSVWSFRTFHRWAKNEAKVTDAVRSKLLENLCLVLQSSRDDDLRCKQVSSTDKKLSLMPHDVSKVKRSRVLVQDENEY